MQEDKAAHSMPPDLNLDLAASEGSVMNISEGAKPAPSFPKEELGVKVQLAEAHSRVFDAFSRAFSRQNLQFEKAIRSLDSLNDQIYEFVLSEEGLEHDGDGIISKQRAPFGPAVHLMRQLLVEAQVKFRKMVEENQLLASRIDGELQYAHEEVSMLRMELADTNKRISQMQNTPTGQDAGPPKDTKGKIANGMTELDKHHTEEVASLKRKNELLEEQNRLLLKELEEIRISKEMNDSKEDVIPEFVNSKNKDSSENESNTEEVPKLSQLATDLSHAREALTALKADRKRMKAEKYDLLNQMKQLYATLEDKEKELRDFIRSYEQRMKESDDTLRQLATERDESEREKWNLLKHARDESERAVSLAAQLGLKDATVRRLEDEVEQIRKQISAAGFYLSDAETIRVVDYPGQPMCTPTSSPLQIPTPTPSVPTPTCSPLPLSVCNSTTNGRGSSADSGVRLSSDKESSASHDGGPGTPNRESSAVIYSTPSTISENPIDDTVAVPAIPSGHDTQSSVCRPMNGIENKNQLLTDSGVVTGNLSRSAEQLCERVAEAAETAAKLRGTATISRKSHAKGGGTWGSISRVFARQKKRAALENSAFDSNLSDKRASWSPSSSLCVSPLTEETYSEKLRLLEDAQHLPLERWKAQTVLAWIEITLGMPQYGALCAENVRSGKVLLELSDHDLENGLGISHCLHRKKLRLAIEELRDPRLRRFPKISVLSHNWVTSEWLADIGLSQYSETFASCLIDGRMLEALTKKELEKYLGVSRKFHQAAIINGIHLLRIVHYDRHLLAERRRQSANVDIDPVVWTNYRFVKWARSIDLYEYADNIKESGVHGALVVLEHSFSSETMATALGISASKGIIRRHLATEFDNLILPARKQVEEQSRFAKMERRRQEKLTPGGSLGRSFVRQYGTIDRSDKDKRRMSIRGSLSRAFGLKMKDELNKFSNDLYISSPTGQVRQGHYGYAGGTLQPRPRSSVVTSSVPYFSNHKDNHRRVRSIGDIDHMTVTPV